MLNGEYATMDDRMAETSWDDLAYDDFAQWSVSADDDGEFDLALHALPTEQELKGMDTPNVGELGDIGVRKERRTALRH